MHTIPSGARSKIAGKKCINKHKTSLLHQYSDYVTGCISQKIVLVRPKRFW